MGKQGKRKQRQKRQQQQQPTKQLQPEGITDKDAINSSSAVHQLRHADPKIRQNALIAMQATVLHPASTKRVNLAVLQAIREQVVDSNLDCASAAAECLAQYLSFTTTVEHQAATTASWTLVLLSRLEGCHQSIQNYGNDAKKVKQWYALAAPCLRALCKLIEINESALEQLNTQAEKFLSITMGLLQDVAAFSPPPAATADARLTEWVKETATFAAQALHSSLDENSDMVDRINVECADPTAWLHLLSSLPDLAKLHLCGSIVTLYQMAPTAWQTTCLTQQVLPCLTQNLVANSQQLQSMEHDYTTAITLWKVQQEDAQLEGEIVQKVQDRKEPAILIARRQKEIDRGSKAKFTEEDTQDGEQAKEDAIVAWNRVLLPLQVALEVTANLLTSFIQDESDMDQDDHEASDREIFQALQAANVAQGVLTVLQTICSYKYSRDETAKKDDLLSEDLQDTISKSSACVANCVLSQVLDVSNYQVTWQGLRPFAASKGVSSVMVVLAQRGGVDLACDMALIQELFKSNDEESQRDGVSLLVGVLNKTPQEHLVTQATQDMLRLLKEGGALGKLEVLNAIMDLWGQDDFYPQVFSRQQVLINFQSALVTLSSDKDLNPESEEILFNSNRFVDYMLGR